MDDKQMVNLLNASGIFPGFFELDPGSGHVRYVTNPERLEGSDLITCFELRAYRYAAEDFLRRLSLYGEEFNRVVDALAKTHISRVLAKRIAATMQKLAELKQTTARDIQLGVITVTVEDIGMAAVRLELTQEDIDKLLGVRSELAESVATEIMEKHWQDVLDNEIRTLLKS